MNIPELVIRARLVPPPWASVLRHRVFTVAQKGQTDINFGKQPSK